MTKSQRQQVFDMYAGHCAYCGCKLTKGWHADHLEPIRRNFEYNKQTGEHVKVTGCMRPQNDCIENMMPSCASCNINKHGMDIEQFRSAIADYMKHLNEVNTQYKIAKRYGLVIENVKPVVFWFEKSNQKI